MTTATLRTAPDTLFDPADLCRHLRQCHQARGRWFAARMWSERLHDLLAPRFATTVSLAAVLLALACGWP